MEARLVAMGARLEAIETRLACLECRFYGWSLGLTLGLLVCFGVVAWR
jgi:hypothetical protein